MGLVTFSTESLSRRPGISVGETVVDLQSVDESRSDARAYLDDLPALEATVRERLADDSGTVESYDATDVTFHEPVTPGKIVRLEGCYEHDLTDEGFNPFIEADGLNEMDWPSHVAVPRSATVGPDEPIVLPQFAEKVRPGVELAFVVGRQCKYLSSSAALDAVGGYLVAGDIAIHDDLPGLFGYKSFDSALPLGPEIVPLDDDAVPNLDVKMAIDGDLVDSQSTSGWRFDPGELLASVSDLMTLEPGDIVLTGDPIRTGQLLEDGDEFGATVGEVGTGHWQVERESMEVGMRI